MKWTPKDIIALVIIVGAVYLLATGRDSWVGASLLAIVAAYYGIDLSPWFRIGRNQRPKKGGNE